MNVLANQTISYLAKRFAESGVRLNTRHGQNFLVDMNLLRLLIERANLGPNDVVLEVGTGTGSLTGIMAPQVAAVVTVEIDEQLFQLAREELFSLPNVTMLGFDALKNKSTFDPRVLAALRHHLAAGPERRLKLVANLPYSVATPVIANLLNVPEEPGAPSLLPTSMTFTVQKEMGDRLAAAPGTKDYGALSIWVQSQCQVECTRILPPGVFWPRPKVHSAIMHLDVDPALRGRITDLDFFHHFARSLFLHRRKFLRSELISVLKGEVDKPGVDAILAETGLSPELRAEQLSVETILNLAAAVRRVTAQL
jgi:16S rRNA (adenine1518-N6/adenine1519-N6)-dimethyltransferase